MKKNLNKVIAISTIAIASIFVFITILVSAGSLELTVFDNALVSGFIAGLALLFIAAAVITVVIAFKDDSMLKNVLLYKDNHSSTKLNARVVIKLIKEANVTVPGVKIKKYLLTADDNGNIKLNLSIKIIDSEIAVVTEALRKAIADISKKVLNVDFISIDFKVYKVVSSFRLPKTDLPKKEKKPTSPLLSEAPVAKEESSEKSKDTESKAANLPKVATADKAVEDKLDDVEAGDQDTEPKEVSTTDKNDKQLENTQTTNFCKDKSSSALEDNQPSEKNTSNTENSYRHTDVE